MVARAIVGGGGGGHTRAKFFDFSRKAMVIIETVKSIFIWNRNKQTV